MKKRWLITGFCIALFATGLSGAKENKPLEQHCSLDAPTIDPNSLETLSPWFIHEEHQNLEEFQQHISELESETGAYGEQLAPALLSLGLMQREAGNVSEAIVAFERALQLIRINDGLYSPKQLPIMELLVETNLASNKWKEATDSLDTMYWLYNRNYERNDPRFLPIIKRLRQWHIDVYNKETERSLKQHFRMAETLYDHAIEIIETCTADRQQALCFWHKSCCADKADQNAKCPAT